MKLWTRSAGSAKSYLSDFRTRRGIPDIACAALFLLVTAASGPAGAQEAKPFGPPSLTATSVSWQSIGLPTSLRVIAPNGVTVVKEFEAGDTPFVGLDELGVLLPDGEVNYELRACFDVDLEALRGEVEAGSRPREALLEAERRIRQDPTVQWGSWLLVSGAFGATERTYPFRSTEDGSRRSSEQGRAPSVTYNEDVTIESGDVDLFLDDTTALGTAGEWSISIDEVELNDFAVETHQSNAYPFVIQNSTQDTTNTLVLAANGKVGIGTATPVEELHVEGGVRINGDLSVLSSRAAKEGFVAIDPQEVLTRLAELPIQEWSYRQDHETRHLGPTSEDFHHAFALGKNERSINPLDLSGVALAAIQGLQAELAQERETTERLRTERDREIAALQEKLEALEKRLEQLSK